MKPGDFTLLSRTVSIIREAANVDQWRYVGSKENPADDASRGMRAETFLKGRRWINGPKFLGEPKEVWPNGG